MEKTTNERLSYKEIIDLLGADGESIMTPLFSRFGANNTPEVRERSYDNAIEIWENLDEKAKADPANKNKLAIYDMVNAAQQHLLDKYPELFVDETSDLEEELTASLETVATPSDEIVIETPSSKVDETTETETTEAEVYLQDIIDNMQKDPSNMAAHLGVLLQISGFAIIPAEFVSGEVKNAVNASNTMVEHSKRVAAAKK